MYTNTVVLNSQYIRKEIFNCIQNHIEKQA